MTESQSLPPEGNIPNRPVAFTPLIVNHEIVPAFGHGAGRATARLGGPPAGAEDDSRIRRSRVR